MAPLLARAALAVALLAATASAITVSFNHGIASGDPTSSAIILWTRVEPRGVISTPNGYETFWNSSASPVNVIWTVSTSSNDFSKPVTSGVFTTTADRDWTVKVDVDSGLKSGVQYYYQFMVNQTDGPAPYFTRSPIGAFKLPFPAGSSQQKSLRYAIFSCANWGWGLFNAYDAATRYTLDFWIHLGDYLYEYNLLNYPTPREAVRWQDPEVGGLSPKNEIVTLEDYRRRHALYRQDPGLQALSAKAPLLAIWDDHEITNNARRDTAENHQASEGDYEARKVVARTAYYEWMPIRDIVNGQPIGAALNRSTTYGNLAHIVLFEQRISARSGEPVVNNSADPSTIRYPAPSIAARIGAIVDNKTSGADYTPAELAALQGVKAFSDAIRNDPALSINGPSQLEWARQETRKAKQAGVTWTLYNHGTVMLERYSDYERAIAEQRAKDARKAGEWERYYNNIAKGQGNTTTAHGLQCYNRMYLGKDIPITAGMRTGMRRNQAAAKFGTLGGFDAWPAYNRERAEFLAIAAEATNAVQYGGDSHADWAGMQLDVEGKPVLAEFDVTGVTSPAAERDAYLPMDFINAALVAGSKERGLRYAYNGNKGFLLVTLTHQVHHAEYIHVNTHCVPNYRASCDTAFDYYSTKYAPMKKGDPVSPAKDLHPAKCAAVPKGTPYSSILGLNSFMGMQASAVP